MVPPHAGIERLSGEAPLPIKARAEWMRFAAADEASSQAAMMSDERPVLSRCVLLGGCALILALIGQAVWRDAPYAGSPSQESGAIRAGWPPG